jgi:hypothetical protein
MCDLCKHNKVASGRKLCAVCDESIMRLADAVRAIQALQRLTDGTRVHPGRKQRFPLRAPAMR